MVSTLAYTASDDGLLPALDAIFPISITPTTLLNFLTCAEAPLLSDTLTGCDPNLLNVTLT